jgi:acetoin utilization protein AcuB
MRTGQACQAKRNLTTDAHRWTRIKILRKGRSIHRGIGGNIAQRGYSQRADEDIWSRLFHPAFFICVHLCAFVVESAFNWIVDSGSFHFPLASGAVCGLAGGTMIVSMWMTRELATVRLETPVTEAAQLMARQKVRRLLVVEKWADGLHLQGILSAKDVIHAFPPHINPFAIEGPDARLTPTTVGQIMTAAPRTTTPDTPIEEAAAVMCQHKIGALPVVRGKTLVGIITESDIFRALVSLLGSDEKGARITFDATKGEDVFELMSRLSKREKIRIVSLIWTEKDGQPVCVVRLAGEAVDAVLDDLWDSGHLILNVIRFPFVAGDAGR